MGRVPNVCQIPVNALLGSYPCPVNRRTRVTGLFPNEASLLRPVGAILMELSEEWETGKRYLNMDVERDLTALKQNKFYRKDVA